MMMRLLGVLVVLFALAAGFAYYRGWFNAAAGTGKDQNTITVTVDKDKINQDKTKAEQDVQSVEPK
jgi:hypothetical protein